MIEEDRLIAGQTLPEEAVYEAAIRPSRLNDYIGQAKVKEQLSVFIDAARNRHEALDHVLIFGPPGLGRNLIG